MKKVRSAMAVQEAGKVASGKPRRAYLPAHERRRQIIEAAQQVFARSNLQGARTRDIAKAAAVNQATLFEHFESKEALFHEAVIEPLLEAMRGMHDRADRYAATASAEEMGALAQASTLRNLETIVGFFPLLAAALFSDLELGRKLYREQIVPLLAARSAAIAPLIKPGLDPELVELATFGMFFAVAMEHTLKGPKAELSAIAAQLTTLAVSGFAREPGGPGSDG